MQGERLQMLHDMVGGLGLHLTVVTDLQSTGIRAEVEPEPIPVAKADFWAFAAEHGYSKQRATLAWSLATRGNLDKYGAHLPLVRFLDGVSDDPDVLVSREDRIVDLRSVHERFVASEGRPLAWGGDHTPDRPNRSIDFLAHLVNEKLRPEEPVAVQRLR